MEAVRYEDLHEADLVVDKVFEGHKERTGSPADPIYPLLGVANQGGFRKKKTENGEIAYVALVINPYDSSSAHQDWPDQLDKTTGQLTYFGDNRKSGSELHETHMGGNAILRDSFNSVANGVRGIPPFFVFEKNAPFGMDFIFRGLAVPGLNRSSTGEDPVAIWRTKDNSRFQNYRALFSILDVSHVDRRWINGLRSGIESRDFAPASWLKWIDLGVREVLISPPNIQIRSKDDQLPEDQTDMRILEVVYEYFSPNPHYFENFAAYIWDLIEGGSEIIEITRRSRDGGRDAIGRQKIGLSSDPIWVHWALEAKCYAPNNSVGVGGVQRLISRLLHRQYGVFVTTSYISEQAYKEIREDGHPVALITGKDIVEVLKEKCEVNSSETALSWLKNNFPET